MIIPTQPNFNVVNTADYRETYANSVQVRVNVWDFFLVFGTMQQQSENQVEVKNFQGIYLSPQQARYTEGLDTHPQLGAGKSAALFALLAALLIASHTPLLRLPYFWDEAGYYVPAARDLLAGSLIPHSTPSNAHPPLVMAWLALCWRIFGEGATVTRCAMLGLAAVSLLGFFRLARAVSNSMVAA